MAPLGKLLMIFGAVLLLVGAAVWSLSSVPYIGQLPGDVHIRRGNFNFYFPLATCILISIALIILLNLLSRR